MAEWVSILEPNRHLISDDLTIESKDLIRHFPSDELTDEDFGKPMGIATYEIGNDIPAQYKSLIPVIDGVQQLLSDESEFSSV